MITERKAKVCASVMIIKFDNLCLNCGKERFLTLTRSNISEKVKFFELLYL